MKPTFRLRDGWERNNPERKRRTITLFTRRESHDVSVLAAVAAHNDMPPYAGTFAKPENALKRAVSVFRGSRAYFF